MIFPEVADERFMQDKLWLVCFTLDFLENDAFFLLDILGAKQRVQHHVGKNVYSDGQVFVQHLCVETDQFFAGEGIQTASD